MRLIHSLKIAPVVLLLGACTQAGQTTGVGAAAGGALGAGLGAIIGSQTGDPGSGLVIGAAAGTAGGALIGNALQAQEEAIRSQDEAIERQERTILAQRAELDELRRMNHDTPTTSKSLSASNGLPPSDDVLTERDLSSEGNTRIKPSDTASGEAKGSFNWKTSQDKTARRTVDSTSASLTDCSGAASEVKNANRASESADKLFHLRRALRLCPDDPDIHVRLGKVYKDLNRKSDAEFEFKEALRLNPDFKPAQKELSTKRVY